MINFLLNSKEIYKAIRLLPGNKENILKSFIDVLWSTRIVPISYYYPTKFADTFIERNLPDIKVCLNCCIKKRLHWHIKNRDDMHAFLKVMIWEIVNCFWFKENKSLCY